MKHTTLPTVLFMSSLHSEAKIKHSPLKISPTRYYTGKLIKSFSTHRKTYPDTQQVLLPFIKTPIKQAVANKSVSNWFKQTHFNYKTSALTQVEKKLLIKLNAIDHDIECCKHHIKSIYYYNRVEMRR